MAVHRTARPSQGVDGRAGRTGRAHGPPGLRCCRCCRCRRGRSLRCQRGLQLASKRPLRDLQAERPHRLEHKVRERRGPEQSLLGPAPTHREVDERAAPRATEVVYRLVHVHARLFGARMAQRSLNRGTVLQVCREEAARREAVVPSAVAALAGPPVGPGRPRRGSAPAGPRRPGRGSARPRRRSGRPDGLNDRCRAAHGRRAAPSGPLRRRQPRDRSAGRRPPHQVRADVLIPMAARCGGRVDRKPSGRPPGSRADGPTPPTGPRGEAYTGAPTPCSRVSTTRAASWSTAPISTISRPSSAASWIRA